MRMHRLVAAGGTLVVVLGTGRAAAQSFCLDDNPAAPSSGLPGPIAGYGAENPFGIPAPPYFPFGLAPSPSLPGPPWAPAGDATILGPGPVVQLRAPIGRYNAALSDNSAPLLTSPDTLLRLRFSVDRLTLAFFPSALFKQQELNQHPGDIFQSTAYFEHPGNFVGLGGPPGYGGLLPTLGIGGASNTLFIDESELGLLAGAARPLLPGAPAPPVGEATHDNVDQFDQQTLDADGDGLNDGWYFVTLYPDEAVEHGVLPADIFDIAPGAQENPGVPFAPAHQMGLEALDAIDALIMWDHGTPGGPGFGGPGAEPGVDYALFSLAPGSKSLESHFVSAADVLFTDFDGRFYRYVLASSMRIFADNGGAPGDDGNIDALEADQCPDDISGDGRVDWLDLLRILGNWGECPPLLCPWDRDGNGVVDFGDVLALLGAWGACA